VEDAGDALIVRGGELEMGAGDAFGGRQRTLDGVQGETSVVGEEKLTDFLGEGAGDFLHRRYLVGE
jgi:hypothetical protein